ncbi:MAG: rod shape-determining protein MreC [Endomicrobium sp.]|jgi:rod shape-determining protein MreC|nr:rod shape-determining protein MreC [Endomicrobium sp.]
MQNNQNSKYANIILIIFLLIGFLFVAANLTPPVKLIKKFIYYVVYPNISTANQIFQSVGNLADNIKSIVYVRQENFLYKQKNQELLDQLRNYETMSTQYEKLSYLLNIPKIAKRKTVFARVSVRWPGEWYQWFIIDKGSDSGLYNELPVAFPGTDGILYAVGRIVETYKSSSKVALITNALSAIPVQFKDKKINCLAEGFNTGEIKVTYIPVQSDIKPGDIIVASPLSSVFPEGMPVGIITNVSREPSLDFKTASASILFDSDNLYEAVILVPQEEEEQK